MSPKLSSDSDSECSGSSSSESETSVKNDIKNVRKDSPAGRGRVIKKVVTKKVEKTDSAKKNVRNRENTRTSPRGATRGRGRPPTRGNKVSVLKIIVCVSVLNFIFILNVSNMYLGLYLT